MNAWVTVRESRRRLRCTNTGGMLRFFFHETDSELPQGIEISKFLLASLVSRVIYISAFFSTTQTWTVKHKARIQSDVSCSSCFSQTSLRSPPVSAGNIIFRTPSKIPGTTRPVYPLRVALQHTFI